jgi:hypothetical protein
VQTTAMLLEKQTREAQVLARRRDFATIRGTNAVFPPSDALDTPESPKAPAASRGVFLTNSEIIRKYKQAAVAVSNRAARVSGGAVAAVERTNAGAATMSRKRTAEDHIDKPSKRRALAPLKLNL